MRIFFLFNLLYSLYSSLFVGFVEILMVIFCYWFLFYWLIFSDTNVILLRRNWPPFQYSRLVYIRLRKILLISRILLNKYLGSLVIIRRPDLATCKRTVWSVDIVWVIECNSIRWTLWIVLPINWLCSLKCYFLIIFHLSLIIVCKHNIGLISRWIIGKRFVEILLVNLIEMGWRLFL